MREIDFSFLVYLSFGEIDRQRMRKILQNEGQRQMERRRKIERKRRKEKVGLRETKKERHK